MLLEAVLLLAIICFLIVLLERKPSDLPPGEWGLPVIGYLPAFGERSTDFFKRLQSKHGNIFCVKMGARLHVVLSDYSMIKTAFGKAEFSDRPDIFTLIVFYCFRNIGIVMTNGLEWMTSRKFALRVLSHFGMGKSKLEETIKVEVNSLIKDLREKVDKPIKIDWNLNVAILNVIWSLVADKRFDHNSDEIHEFTRMREDNLNSLSGSVALLDMFPWVIPFLPRFIMKMMKIDTLEKSRDALMDHFDTTIAEHRATFDKNNMRDYIDMYIGEFDSQDDTQPPSLMQDPLQLKASLIDLFAAGSGTSSASIRWYILYMAKYPEIQKKIQQEIDLNVPRDRFPSLEDKDKLPYLEASIYESLRIVSLIPMDVPHATNEDIIMEGYRIPKGTVVLAGIEMCHHNSDYWEHPDVFYPDHFIDDDGKFYIREKGFLAFSKGRRKCLGEALARMELFLFLGAILQNFTICEPEGQELSLVPDHRVDVLNSPSPYEIILRAK